MAVEHAGPVSEAGAGARHTGLPTLAVLCFRPRRVYIVDGEGRAIGVLTPTDVLRMVSQ